MALSQVGIPKYGASTYMWAGSIPVLEREVPTDMTHGHCELCSLLAGVFSRRNMAIHQNNPVPAALVALASHAVLSPRHLPHEEQAAQHNATLLSRVRELPQGFSPDPLQPVLTFSSSGPRSLRSPVITLSSSQIPCPHPQQL